MKKNEFLNQLRDSLRGLPQADIEERVSFYSEMIDDRIEEGLSEEEAINDIGGIDSVLQQVSEDTPIVRLVKERIKPKRRISGLEIVLLILGFPLWFPLLIVFGVLVLVFFLLMWVMVIVSYSVEVSLIATSIAGFLRLAIEMYHGQFYAAYLGIGLLGFGCACLFLIACIYATKGSAKLMKVVLVKMKRRLIGGKKNA